MRRECIHARCYAPYVKLKYSCHSPDFKHGPLHFLIGYVGRNAFHQDVCGLFDQSPGSCQNKSSQTDADYGVCQIQFCKRNDDSSRNNPGSSYGITESLQTRRSEIEIFLLMPPAACLSFIAM